MHNTSVNKIWWKVLWVLFILLLLCVLCLQPIADYIILKQSEKHLEQIYLKLDSMNYQIKQYKIIRNNLQYEIDSIKQSKNDSIR